MEIILNGIITGMLLVPINLLIFSYLENNGELYIILLLIEFFIIFVINLNEELKESESDK